MQIKEYINNNLKVECLWEILEELRDGKNVDILHIVLNDESEIESFLKTKQEVENKSLWRFESTPSAPLVYTARYVPI